MATNELQDPDVFADSHDESHYAPLEAAGSPVLQDMAVIKADIKHISHRTEALETASLSYSQVVRILHFTYQVHWGFNGTSGGSWNCAIGWPSPSGGGTVMPWSQL